jgi:hypothetical protein
VEKVENVVEIIYRKRTTENFWGAIGLKLATGKGMKVV